jgi:UDP:flavonoid glycosyltransferase YjiC (YdhE family)
MRVFILTLGTRGDFELFLTLAQALTARGHHVLLGTSPFYAQKTRDAGVEWRQIGAGSQQEMVAILRSLAAVSDRNNRTYQYYTRWLRPQLAMAKDAITSVGAEADYFISNLKMALQRGDTIIPGAFVTYDPPGSIEDLPRYGARNHAGRTLELVALNEALVDPEGTWGVEFHFTGFWRRDHNLEWTPPQDLMHFLDGEKPPVIMTMGSMVMCDIRQVVQKLVRALCLAGRRGIVVGGWSDISSAGESSARIHFTVEVPYDWLFPRGSCIIHHGGCGTVAAVLRAGKPSILLPQISCQDHFGRMLSRAELATGVLDTQRMAPEELAEAIQRAVADERIIQKARHWRDVVLGDGGVETAADLIEAHCAGVHKEPYQHGLEPFPL